jgi:nitrogen fixation protein FixH
MNAIAQPRFTGRHMLIIMLVFFGVIFAVNFTMVYFAISSWTGLVVKNAYVASQQFNASTAALKAAAAGVNASVAYDKPIFKITFTDDKGIALAARNVSVTLGRPSHERDDQTVVLRPVAGGFYTARIVLKNGQWSGRVSADISGHSGWQRPLRLTVKE